MIIIIEPQKEVNLDLSKFHLFKDLNEKEISQLNLEQTTSLYKKESVIYSSGSQLKGFYCVNRGILKLYKNRNDGKIQIISFAKEGDIIAYRSVLSEELTCSTAQVIEECVLSFLPYKTILYLIQNNWQFRLHLLQVVCEELRESNNYIIDITQKSVRELVAEALILLKENFGLDNANNLRIIVKRAELANLIGSTPEGIIRTLSEFKQSQLIDLQGRKIKLINIRELTKVANLV